MTDVRQIYIYKRKISIVITSVGLASARPNNLQFHGTSHGGPLRAPRDVTCNGSVLVAKNTLAKMEHTCKGTYPYILLLALMSFADANLLQSYCSRITVNDLGSTTEFSTEGLVSRAIGMVTSGLGNNVTVVSPVPVRIRNFAIVCDASGDRINTSFFVSVVVEFQCNSQSSTSSLIVCNDPSIIVTRQYQFQCIEQNGQPVWNTSVAGSNSFVQTLNPTATLSTPLADQCRRCLDDQQSGSADPTTHCIRKSIIDHALYLLIMIIMCPQRVQHDVTRDRDVAILGKQMMCAVTFTSRITVQMSALVVW